MQSKRVYALESKHSTVPARSSAGTWLFKIFSALYASSLTPQSIAFDQLLHTPRECLCLSLYYHLLFRSTQKTLDSANVVLHNLTCITKRAADHPRATHLSRPTPPKAPITPSQIYYQYDSSTCTSHLRLGDISIPHRPYIALTHHGQRGTWESLITG